MSSSSNSSTSSDSISSFSATSSPSTPSASETSSPSSSPPPTTSSSSSISSSSSSSSISSDSSILSTPPPSLSTSSTSSASNSSSIPSSLTSSSSSVLTAPVTTVIKTTVVSTSDGQVFTTVFSTQSTAPAGSTVTVGSDSSGTSQSHARTGAIVGGVVGGTVGLLFLVLGALWYIRRRRRFQDEAFDGNFDPDRIVRPASGAGHLGGRAPTLPNIPVTNSDEQLGPGSPEMAEMDDDGVGGRLNASAIGAGIVAPYPLYQPMSPARSAGSPPPLSARSWGTSSDAQHSMTGNMPDWRGPSPGPSIPTQYTGGSGSGSHAMGVPPSSYPSSTNVAHLPPGAAPGPVGAGIPASAYAGAQHRRRTSNGTASSGERQPLYASSSPGSASSNGGASVQSGGRFTVANPDEGMVQNRYAGGYSEEARRAYIVGGPSGKSPSDPSQPRPREVLVHEDGGRIESNDPTSESEGPDEIPPTYDSLLSAAGMAAGSSKEKHS
ncbi:hypothetical protein GYMLUDRAFT_36720 [Collybiopsis luxurians FD-317 M1]|nr:hypothetical protein GYMLUDRAFT_36720 [Collybiopsis luxurians FD-317 M1]